jgi:outer membrane protein TolC
MLLTAKSQLLPNLSAGITESEIQRNLKAFGFGSFPGIPYMVGPFGVFDGRFTLSQTILDFRAIQSARAGKEHLNAAELAYRNVREQVVFVCGDLYLQAISGKDRITAVRTQLNTAQTLYELAVDRKNAGIVPGIEVLRAQVELQTQQQRLIVVENDFAKQKLNLARAIGLPLGHWMIGRKRTHQAIFPTEAKRRGSSWLSCCWHAQPACGSGAIPQCVNGRTMPKSTDISIQ